MQPTDLVHLVIPSDPRWHPDGRRLVVVVARTDLDEDRYDRSLQLWDGDRLRPLTSGPGDVSPRWSPDGTTLAFLRTTTAEGAAPQLALLPSDGGEARVVTDLARGVSDLAWSPDGRHLVVVGATWIDGLADLEPDERGRRPRRITRFPYRSDTDGWVCDRREQLWLVTLGDRPEDAPTVRELTDLPHDVTAPAWHPDGTHVVAITRAEGLPPGEPHDQLVTVEVASGEVRRGPIGSWEAVAVAPDGALHVAGLTDPFDWPGVHRVYRVAAGDDPAGPPPDADLVDLTGHLDRDTVAVAPARPRFLPGAGPDGASRAFVTGLEDRGGVRLVRVDEHGAADVVDSSGRAITGADVHPDGQTLAICWTDPRTPGELSVIRGGVEEVVTDLGDRFRAEVEVAPTERWIFERDGAELDAWSVLPPGFADGAERSVPVLFNIHGGPTSQYGDVFFDEFQVEAGAGYLVVGINPRGSSGRGTDWARAVVGVWMQEESDDLADLRAVTDEVLARYPQADPDRVGVMGGSYGGYATARLLALDRRFASAIVERGLLEWGSFSGTSDIGPFFDRMFLGASFDADPAPHHAASPVFTADRVTTPTLVLHSEHDWRCPIEQAERYFLALLRAGVTAELVRFPGEGHELSRSGKPKHRRERFEVVLDWHARFLHP